MWLCEYDFRTIETHVISLWFQFSLIGFILLRVLMEDFSHVPHVSECFSNCDATPPPVWHQLLTTLSLSSLPFPPPCRKAETESGKLVTVKRKRKTLILLIHQICVAAFGKWQQPLALTGSYNLISHRGHCILQPYWSIQCHIISISVMPKCHCDICDFLLMTHALLRWRKPFLIFSMFYAC